MTPIRRRIVVSSWVHDDVLARLAEIGEVDANRRRTAWSREELVKRAASGADKFTQSAQA